MRTLFLFSALILSMPFFSQAEEGAGMNRVYHLDVSFDFGRSAVIGTVTAPARAGEKLQFQTGTLGIMHVSVNGKEADAGVKDGVLTVLPAEEGNLEIKYEGVFKQEETGGRNYGVVPAAIEPHNISLTGLWHPMPAGLAGWFLTVSLPFGYEAVSEAETVVKTQQNGQVHFSFNFQHPTSGLSLVASDRYEVSRDRYGSVELYAYFFREDRELAKKYLESTKKYLALYEKLLLPFPYKRFSVVENFLPTGYSFPTFTLLGQDVVRLPFITETSLGHEILHQWFGNSVYSDDEKGNWAEGVTTYLADHWYEEQKGAGWEYRKQLLTNYAAYVNASNDFPLREFRSRTDQASRAIGYGKAAMVFHALRTKTGDEAFFNALREFISMNRFRNASWDDIRSAFEKLSGKDFMHFFSFWIDEKGIPEISVENASIRRKGSKFEISLTISRKGGSLPVDLPVSISFMRGGNRKESIAVDADKKEYLLTVNDEPSLLVIDADYDIIRKPTSDEMPPVIAAIIGDEKPILVPPVEGESAYSGIIDEFAKRGGARKEPSALKDADIKTSSLIILGRDNPAVRRLFGRSAAAEGGFSIAIRKNPWNKSKVIAIIHAASEAESKAAFEKIFHYGKYSRLVFSGGKNIDKKTDRSERGIIVQLREEPVVVDVQLLKKFGEILQNVSDKRIVYVGEYHDRFSHHNIQLQIIQAVHKTGRPMAVGMEMFQRPFQKTLDDYIAGVIDEREFLAKSEYFKRWGFDYNLYKPILDFCRAERIPVVALNLGREITEKVAKSGMDSLTDEERKSLPREMDFSDEEYAARIRQVFDQHKEGGERNLDFFLQAQILWDETMAESISDYLSKNPDRTMVVIAGGGHVVYGAGIPVRAFRRNGLPYTIILNDGEIEPSIADYIVLPQSIEGATAPKLLVTFKEYGGRLVINDFIKDSPAKAAGLKAGDVLTALDNVPVSTMQDIRLALFYKNPGDKIRVTVLRKRFLLGEKEMTVDVKL